MLLTKPIILATRFHLPTNLGKLIQTARIHERAINDPKQPLRTRFAISTIGLWVANPYDRCGREPAPASIPFPRGDHSAIETTRQGCLEGMKQFHGGLPVLVPPILSDLHHCESNRNDYGNRLDGLKYDFSRHRAILPKSIAQNMMMIEL